MKEAAFITILILLLSPVLVSGVLAWNNTPTPTPTPIPATVVTPQPAGLGNVTVHFIDVGQGDSVFIDTNGKDVLIDGGERTAGSGVVNYLHRLNITKIDIAVGTHQHADHVGGLITVMQTVTVLTVYDDGAVETTQTYQDYINLAKQRSLITAERGQKIQLDNMTFITVLNPKQPLEFEDENDNSIVIRMEVNSVSFLFTGDAGGLAEQSILLSGFNVSGTVLKVGHHGSLTSTTQSFLDAVNPEVAVISVGEGNSYEHPHQETLTRLAAKNVDTYRTDLDGTVTVTTDGSDYTVTTEKTRVVTPSPTPTATVSPTQLPTPTVTRTPTTEKEEKVDRGCIIATSTYGSVLASEVQFLRNFREETVYSTFAGTSFMALFNKFYYSWSPAVAAQIWRSNLLQAIGRVVVHPLLGILRLSTLIYTAFGFAPELGIVVAGLVASSLIGIVYFLPITLIPIVVMRKYCGSIPKAGSLKPLLIPLTVSLGSITLAEASASPILMMISTGMLVVFTIALTTGILALKMAQFIPDNAGRRGIAASQGDDSEKPQTG